MSDLMQQELRLVIEATKTNAGTRKQPKTLQYLMGHSDIGVTLNIYTHLGLEDAAAELKRLEDLKKAQAEMEKMEAKEKPVSKNMFRAI